MVTESLHDFFVRHNSCSATTERDAIFAFERLLTDSTWRPTNPYLGGFLPIIEIGILANRLNTVESARERIADAVTKITNEGSWSASNIAELHVGALLTQLGCRIRYLTPLKVSQVRTPDLVCNFAEGVTIDIEVARANEKDGHRVHKENMRVLSDAINLSDDANYAIFVADRVTEEVAENIVEALIELLPGQRNEDAGKWAVVAGYPDEHERFVGGAGHEELIPAWWGDGPNFKNVMTRIGSSHSPVTLITTKVPMESYLNPIRRKAERPQRTGNHPYLIVLDTTRIPGAFERLGSELSPYFQIWSDVSGVLLELPFFAFQDQSWRCSLLRNRHANKCLPLKWLDGLTAKRSHIVARW